jgi:AraC family transcriptional regulator of adaptative response / DNA-3-methyladenine glycosylase II
MTTPAIVPFLLRRRFDGRLFVGVKTTGIYCRPICPARTPKRENVTFHPSARGAGRGFPTLSALPSRDRAGSGGPAWNFQHGDASLSLIEMGALDEVDVAALAERLGLGERQLRRLFHRHLGASPIAVAQTRRVLLAKQLIHETRLPMTEVALAAGFGSIRRFNETFRQLFGRPPGALRRSSAAEVSSGPNGEISILLRYRPPYDWPAMLSYLRLRAIPGVEVVSCASYARTIEIDGVHGIVSVQPGEGNALRVAVQFPKLAALPAIIARLRRVFDLAADPQAIGAQLAVDPTLAPLVAARPGVQLPAVGRFRARHPRGARPADHGDRRNRLGRQACRPVWRAARQPQAGGSPRIVFPRPQRLAGVDLSVLGMPRHRAAALASWQRRSRRTRKYSARDAASTRRSHNCARSPASASGPLNTSPCANCVNRMRFPLPILV